MAALTTEDRLAIGELLAAYCWTIDFGRWDDLPGFFTTDCRLDFGTLGVHEGHDGVRRFAKMIGGIGVRMRHYTTNVVVTGDGASAESRSYVLAFVGEPGALQTTTGRYEDRLVKQDGRWLLRERRAVIEMPAR
jgi:hypothetical protein